MSQQVVRRLRNSIFESAGRILEATRRQEYIQIFFEGRARTAAKGSSVSNLLQLRVSKRRKQLDDGSPSSSGPETGVPLVLTE